jgi:hypothetical protein
MDETLERLRRMAVLNPTAPWYAPAVKLIEEQQARIEELETANSTLDIAVAHWRELYRNLDLLYSQLAGRD